jgi:phosphoglycerol transferase MdoB-like AlkP superfamily enzyme
MKRRLTALGYYSLFWLIYFIFARILFLVTQFQTSSKESLDGILLTFWYGSRLDISTIGYYLLLPCLAAIPTVYFNGEWYRVFMRWYTRLLILFSTGIIISDINLYPHWGFRMDHTPLLYLKTPFEAMASANTYQLIQFFTSIPIITLLFICLCNKFIDRLFGGLEKIRLWLPGILFFLVLLGSLIIPIRGGFGLAPINAGSVYFSNKMFLNHSAINAVWNVGTSAVTQKPVKNPYKFGDLKLAESVVDSLTVKKGLTRKVLNTDRPNIIIIALESFSGYLIGPLGGDSLVTPNFNRYAKEGLLFSNFYAAGTRTDKAMPAILNGYPAQPAQSIIKEPKKSQSLPGMVKMLIDNGYQSSFWYGGEIDFANFNSFIIGSGFQSIITKANFDKKDYNSKWGVHDHVLFKALEDSLQKIKEPFFNLVLTLSSHEPFDVPMETVFEGKDNMTKYKNSVYYSDQVLGQFLDWAKQQPWWKNTLIVMVADHCGRVSEDQPVFTPVMFRIPMLWVGGALATKDSVVGKFGGEIDIPVTILNQMDIESNFPFGKDMLSDESNSYAFYVFNEGFGFVTDSSSVAYDHKAAKMVLMDGAHPERAEKNGKAFLQVLFEDYLKR